METITREALAAIRDGLWKQSNAEYHVYLRPRVARYAVDTGAIKGLDPDSRLPQRIEGIIYHIT